MGDVDKLANNIYQAMTGRPVSSLEGTGWKTLAFKARRCLHALHELDSDHFWEAYDDKVKNPQLRQVFVGAILLRWNRELEISGSTSSGEGLRAPDFVSLTGHTSGCALDAQSGRPWPPRFKARSKQERERERERERASESESESERKRARVSLPMNLSFRRPSRCCTHIV